MGPQCLLVVGLPALLVPHSTSLSPAMARPVLSAPAVHLCPSFWSGCMFLFYRLGVGLPCPSVFCQFWLCEEAQCVYLHHHLGSLLPSFLNCYSCSFSFHHYLCNSLEKFLEHSKHSVSVCHSSCDKCYSVYKDHHMSNHYYVLSLVPSILLILSHLIEDTLTEYGESIQEQSLGFSKLISLKLELPGCISDLRRRCVLFLSKASTSRDVSVPTLALSTTSEPCFPGADSPDSPASLSTGSFLSPQGCPVCRTCVEKSQVECCSV